MSNVRVRSEFILSRLGPSEITDETSFGYISARTDKGHKRLSTYASVVLNASHRTSYLYLKGVWSGGCEYGNTHCVNEKLFCSR